MTDTFDPATAGTPEADLRHTYDASDQRVIKEAKDDGGNSSFTVYVFESLELRRTQYDSGFADDESGTDYQINHYTVVPYLLANGVRMARLVYHAVEGSGADVPQEDYQPHGAPGDVNGFTPQAPAVSEGKLHVFFELGDHLGSTSVVLDKATGELVERATFQGYGGAESDYRPDRWKSFREDYRFTGKEEDVEVGLQYFGKRYLNPLLGRWVSADPLAVHSPGGADLNLYAYVSGHVLKSVDPLGLCEEGTSCEAVSSNEDGSVGNSDGTSDNSSNAPEMAEAYGGESEAPDCWAAGCNPVTGDYSDRDKWESEQQAKQDGQIAVATVGASVIPGAGEAMDLAVLADPTSTPTDILLAMGSLTASIATIGLAPNFGALAKADDLARGTSNGAGGLVAPQAALQEPRFIVSESGVSIPTDPAELNQNLSLLTDTSTNPATSRKFVGEDSQGPMRVRVERAHPDDPNFQGAPDPLHTVDHLHIDRRANGQSGSWGSAEKVQYDWPF